MIRDTITKRVGKQCQGWDYRRKSERILIGKSSTTRKIAGRTDSWAPTNWKILVRELY